MKPYCCFPLVFLLGALSVNCNDIATKTSGEPNEASTALRYLASPEVSAAADNLEKIQVVSH
jgi:hypothetical protein